MTTPGSPAVRLTFTVCLAEALSMTGFAAFTTLLPQLQREWSLSNSEAGAIGGIYYAGYMLAVPVLTSLTDRMDSRRVYLAACLLSTLGALATTMFGLLCGGLLRRGQARALLLTGIAAALVGWWWSRWLPWNKQLWTPSFALWTGGLAAIALAAAHAWIDHLGRRPWGRAFGLNAIGAYAGAWISTVLLAATGWMAPLYARVFGPVSAWAGPQAQSLAFEIAFVDVWDAIVWALDRRGWYWKV